LPKFTKGTPKPPNSGKRKGSPNKGTESARRLIEADGKAIVDQIVRDAKANNPHALQVGDGAFLPHSIPSGVL
jgi:hypothetical protein